MIAKPRSSRLSVLLAAGLMCLLLLVLVLPITASGDGARCETTRSQCGSPSADTQLIGLFTVGVQDVLKAKYPSDQWPWVRNVRLMVRWHNIEGAKGNYYWEDLDAEVNAALSLGIESILITLTGPNPAYATDYAIPDYPEMGPPKNMGDWEDFCGAVAGRYKDYVDYYQVWQEPGWDLDTVQVAEGKIYYYGYCDQSYMGMMRAAYNGIKANDPDSYVVTGSLMNGLTREESTFANYELLLAGGNQDLSMKVTADRDIVAERPMYFNYHGVWPGGHDQVGIQEPGTTWYLAEGATHSGFEEWICIQNPGDTTANVTITYMFTGGETQDQLVQVTAHSRFTVNVNGAVGPNRDVSAKLTSDQPIVVERPIYFNYHGWCTGGSIEAGIKDLSDTWYLAEGATQPGFEEWISLMNPGNEHTDVKITYMFPGGATQVQQLKMPPTSRETVLVNDIVGPNKDVSAKIEATNDIIAERPMYFNYHGKWTGGHDQVGATAPGDSWFLSEGTTRNNDVDGAFDEWISIQNPGDTDAKVDLTYMFTDGGTQPQTVTVDAHSRRTIMVNSVVGNNRDVSVQLNSDQGIVVERPMYFSYHNAWPGGTVELACQSSAETWYFAEGTTRPGFEEWLTLQNPNAQEATATITYMFTDGTTQDQAVSLPPNSRTTVDVNHSVSIATICDGVAVHPYDYSEWWGWYYSQVVNICNKNGYPNREVVCTEIGWPHAGRDEFSVEGQRQAIGEVGVGGLRAAGCRKIWIFQAVDPAPGESWDDIYLGLYGYDGSPFPAWNEYRNWQNQTPKGPDKPDHLW
ncbi:MAG: hypothetical protein KJ907_11125 [Actinobacteria bacterium]|nr:hypothetical protein [Actinomycetota bacterium]